MKISLIVAMDENGLIGANGGMPWHLPNDLRHFKRTTMGKPLFMGRRTHESIGRALPGRENLVLSRDETYQAKGCHTVTSFQAAQDLVRRQSGKSAQEMVVIGGAQVYTLALPEAHHMYLTRVHGAFTGDTWFPDFDAGQWQQVSCERHPADDKNPHAHSFIELRRQD